MKNKIVFLVASMSFSSIAYSSDIDVKRFLESSKLPVNDKKEVFFEQMYEAIVKSNKEIIEEKNRIENTVVISSYCDKYRIKECSKEKLLNKVNVIPPSLALAQAANESAWGTSRFAQKANNLFGEWCFNQGCGIIPNSRPEGEKYEVQKFKSVKNSIMSYMHNLNSHPAYSSLRKIRNEVGVDGIEMAKGLESYSARGDEYIKELQSMIRYNNLEKYDEMFEKEVEEWM